MTEFLGFLFDNALKIEWQQVLMWVIGSVVRIFKIVEINGTCRAV